MRTHTLRAPAKLNLGLRVLGRRPDGYHLIESLFVPLDLADEVTVEVSTGQLSDGTPEGVEFTLLGPTPGESPPGSVPADGSNLAAEAARRFLAQTEIETGKGMGTGAGITATRTVRLSLRKRIPAGAGLGGGSSDAGAVLRALAASCALPVASLSQLALGLGADVPYFLDPRPAIVSGIGERIEPIETLRPLCVLLVNPGISLATADVFRAFDQGPNALTPARPGYTMRALSGLQGDPGVFSSPLEELLVNDLESAAIRLCPQIPELRERLRHLGAQATGMSGSGATVFGLFPNATAAQEALEKADFALPIWAQVAKIVGTQ